MDREMETTTAVEAEPEAAAPEPVTESAITDRFVRNMRKVAEQVAMEAAQDYVPVYVDPREAGWQQPEGRTAHTLPYLQSSPRDRQDGRFLPVYDTEADLRILRAVTRLMAETVPAAQSVIGRLTDYTVASGYDYQISPAEDVRETALSKRANRIWDQFSEDNGWASDGEREAFSQSHKEGEWLAWPEPVDGSIELCDATSDEITEPAIPSDIENWLAERYGMTVRGASWNFGVHRRTKGRRILGFHVVRDNVGADWDYVRASEAAWLKRYTPSRANRGVSAFFLPHQYLQRGDKVFRNTSDGAAVQAAIAYIVEHAAGTTKTQLESLTAGQDLVGNLARSYASQKGGGTVPENVSGISPGTVPHVKNGQKVHAGPLGSNQSPIYIDVMQTAMRMSGAIWAMTEGMVTGDWSNGNYASMLTAEGPFIQGRKADQALTGKQFERLPWLVLRIAFLQGQFRGVAASWEQVENGLKVRAEAPRVGSRDDAKETQKLSAEYEKGIISKRKWQTEAGYDPDEENEQIEAERGSEPQRPNEADQQSRQLGRQMENVAGLEATTFYP